MAERHGALSFGTILISALLLLSCGNPAPGIQNKTFPYLYEDTKQLVSFVEAAASLLEKTGESAFAAFSRKDSRWFNDKRFLFAYELDGLCVFHPVNPDLVGKNLMTMKDINGKPVVAMITDIGRMPENDASGWVFYHWVDRTQLDPMWKASYIRKVVAPDKKVYVIGCGLNNLKIEKAFVRSNVDRAASLIREQGREKAFPTLLDAASSFCFLGTYITVIDAAGKTLVDPAFPSFIARNMVKFRDAVGREVLKLAMEKLNSEETVWLQYLWPKSGEAVPSRKLLYCRKVSDGGELLFVCSDFFLATPIWMRL